MLPRINSHFRTGMVGFDTLRKEWLIEIAQKADDFTHQDATKYNLNLLALTFEAKEKITEELCINNSFFTGLVFVGIVSEVSNHNHPHLDTVETT